MKNITDIIQHEVWKKFRKECCDSTFCINETTNYVYNNVTVDMMNSIFIRINNEIDLMCNIKIL